MGQATSVPVSRGANAPSSRRIRRLLTRGEGAGDGHGRPHTQEELEAPTPGPHACAPPRHPHLDHDPHLAQGHSLVRAHHPQYQQAPSTTEAGEATAGHRSPKETRVGGTAMAQSPETAADPAAATGKAPGSARQEETAPAALAQVQASTSASATPASSTYCSAQSLEQSRECLFDPPPASSSATATTSAPVATTPQPLEQPGQRILDPASTTSPSTSTPAAPVSPIAAMESLQSALASSHTAATPDSTAETLSPTLSPSALPTVPPLPSSSTIPRTLPLGTSMIVQGLVQTIEVSRAARNNASAREEPTTVEQAPLMDKGKEKEGDKGGSGPLASGSSSRGSPTLSNTKPDSNTPDPNTATTNSNTTPDSNNSDSSSNGDLSDDTPGSPSTTTSIDTPPIAIDTPNTTPATTPPPRSSPSSTEVLGLLLSIAAQATAEALVPWSVPPRSRTTPREGIVGGLAAAFSALAGSGAGTTAANPSPGTGMTAPEPLPQPQPIIQPPTPRPPRDSDSQDSSSRFSRRFSRLSTSSSRVPSMSSRRLSSFIPGRRSETGRRVSTPTRRAASPSPRRTSSTPVPGSLRRGVLDRLERWVPRRLRRESQGRPASPSDELVDFGRAPPISTLSGPALPESSVSPLPSPPLHDEPPVLVQSSGPGSPVSERSGIPVSPSLISVPTPPTLPGLALPNSTPSAAPIPPSTTPTTDAEDLIRFSQMLGFTPGIVHPPGSFERFLADMQDELRGALGEYQERVRSQANTTSGEGPLAAEESATSEEAERSRTAALLDHTRPHVPSTDPLPLNWWRMYSFPALPDGRTESGSGAGSAVPTSVDAATATTTGNVTGTGNGSDAAPTDADAQQPIHPAIIIGLRSISRDPTEPVVPTESEGARARPEENADRVRSSESDRVRSPESARARSSESDRVRSPESARARSSGDRVRSSTSRDRLRSRRLFRLGDEEERRPSDGTRNYIIWIIGGYYPANHPILTHPNLFLGQVHPDELWRLSELLGQVKTPTVSREDIAKAGLRVVKGAEIKELAQSGSVTENCTERCLICLDDYTDDDDLRIMTCKHMFHKDCVDRWMETGRNNCPACRTTGVETNPSPEPASAPAPAPVL